MIKIAIISDIKLYRDGLELVFRNADTLEVIGKTNGGSDVCEKIAIWLPNIVIVDMSSGDNCGLIKRVSCDFPEMKLVVIALPENPKCIADCVEAGILGYLPEETSLEELFIALNTVNRGEIYCPQSVAESIVKNMSNSVRSESKIEELPAVNHKNSVIESLTRRERQIAGLLSGGLSNKQIARDLTIELSTVKNHVHNILVKMGADSRLRAVSILKDNNIVDLYEP